MTSRVPWNPSCGCVLDRDLARRCDVSGTTFGLPEKNWFPVLLGLVLQRAFLNTGSPRSPLPVTHPGAHPPPRGRAGWRGIKRRAMADERDPGAASGSATDHPARLRWAVNTERWSPSGDHEGAEFGFLLSLLPRHEREECLKFVHMPDKKRALVSRLLQRAACARVTSAPHASIEIRRTKGRKPFLASPLPDPALAPNFNFNVSHEGDFVVLASEPVAVCGVDVAAPGQARRRRRDGRKPSIDEMLKVFANVLTPNERAAVENAAGDDEAKEDVFRRHWSLKEALVKAMGVGLAMELNRADFECEDEGAGVRRAGSAAPRGRLPGGVETATLRLDGEPKTRWRFFMQPLGVRASENGGGRHWVTVSRGPFEDVTDANGEFSATWRRVDFTDEEWAEAVDAPSPPFSTITVSDLVPEHLRGDFEEAGGDVY